MAPDPDSSDEPATLPRAPRLVKDLMTTSNVSVGPGTRVRDALLLMERYQVRHLPVIDAERVVGFVSKSDVRETLGYQNDEAHVHDRLDWPVERVMANDLTLAHPATPLPVAIDLLVKQRLTALPVVDPDDCSLQGVLSVIDVLIAARGYFE